MSSLTWGLLALFGVAAAVDWWAVGTGRVAVEKFAKPAATGVLLVAAATIDAGVPALTQWAFVAGLALALAGDVLLLPPRRFMPGLVAFLAAHVAFIVGLLVLPSELVPFAVGAVLVALGVATVGMRILVAVANGPRSSLREAVGIYLLVISMMTILAWSTGVPALIAGGTLFMVSDAVLAWREFVDERPWMRLTVTATYHGALLLLVLGLLG